MNIYILKRELLIDLVHTAFVRGYVYFERDILAQRLDKPDVRHIVLTATLQESPI